MSLRDQLTLKDGEILPPFILKKACVHNGSPTLEYRLRGDMSRDMDYVLGIQQITYVCIQCGHTVSVQHVMVQLQEYMLTGRMPVFGRKLAK